MKQKKRKVNPRLILASESPRRKALMRGQGYRFIVEPSAVSENVSEKMTPRKFVRHLALKKALHISRRNPSDVVLGADTIVYIRDRIIGKPKDGRDADRILNTLSGAWQRVYTGVAVVCEGGEKKWLGSAVSYVKFRKLTKKDIDGACGRHMDKAGAYSVQEKKDPFVEKISGDFDNVVGLPMKVVNRLLSRCAHHFLKTIGHHIHFKV